MAFEESYEKIPDNIKLEFFNAKIKNDNKLQKEFSAFAQAKNNLAERITFEHFLNIVKSTQDEYTKHFEQVDLENPDWDSYHSPHSGYIEEWEAYQYASEQEFESIFKLFLNSATNAIIKQKPDELMALLIGLYEATQDAEIADEVGSFEDVNEYLLTEHTDVLNQLIDKIRLSALAENTIITVFERFYQYAGLEYPSNPHFVAYFEKILLALAEKSNNADQILAITGNSTTGQEAVPELILLLNKKTGNTEEWLMAAQRYYRSNTEVAKQLLEYYFKRDKKSFLKTAHELFPTGKISWSEFLQNYISPQLDKNLFVDVFWQLTISQESTDYYLKIKDYISETELKKLLEELRWNQPFVAEILELEQKYDDIRNLVIKCNNDYDYEKIIRPILQVFPEFCFENIKNRATQTIENHRGRNTYERVASWLRLLQLIPGYENGKRQLMTALYNHKPNLPALKDEMRKAGLVQ
jgi:hypothetical protein